MDKKNLLWGLVAIIIILAIAYYSGENLPSQKSETSDVSAVNGITDTTATDVIKAPKTSTIKKSATPITITPSINSGRVVFAIKDKAENINDIRSIFVTIASVKINHPTKGWITIPNSAKEFDLLEIKKSGLFGLLSDTYLEADSYNQLWLTITKVNILKLDGSTVIAKLPSQNIRFNAFSKIVKGETAAITFDFDVEKSLHITTDNKEYLFLPVVETSIQNTVYINMFSNGKFTFSSGTTGSSIKVGMNENGDIIGNYSLNPLTEIEFIGNIIKLRPYYLSEEKLTASAAQAIEIVTNGKYLDSVISIKLLEDEIWQIYGKKNSSNITIQLEAKTGKIIGQ